MKRSRYLFLFFFLLAVFLFFIVFIFYLQRYSVPLETRSISLSFEVGEVYAFDLNTSFLSFGRLPPGGFATRSVSVDNTYPFPIEVVIIPSESILSYAEHQSSIYLASGAHSSVKIGVSVPETISGGRYSGTVTFFIYRSRKSI
ncbi:MAG TPA: hypothetical protein VJK51_05235 [Candidatus Nanoarchaeia archaeon]|nr:hypothetical protein [Candidatus Nanoarchaeia archaeon]